MPDRLALYYGAIHVADVRDADCSQSTWDGEFQSAVVGDSELEHRLRAFIALGEDWYWRMYRNPMDPPDAKEFDPYRDLIDSDSWQVRLPDGTIFACLKCAPAFMHLKGLSWKCRPSSRE